MIRRFPRKQRSAYDGCRNRCRHRSCYIWQRRNSEFGGKKIKEGDIIALENGKLTITEKNPVKAVVKLAKNMVTRDTSFITLIYGNDISEEDAKTAFNELSDKFGSRTDVTLVKGDQPVYYFILSVE